ncbi:unnamed protein product [Calicophoron daubneyi]|uniref:Ribosomal protein S4 n=1 Tax=Calicophoron daubneyi TaxID=300641 RepID=A0AAV2T389_CALDB
MVRFKHSTLKTCYVVLNRNFNIPTNKDGYLSSVGLQEHSVSVQNNRRRSLQLNRKLIKLISRYYRVNSARKMRIKMAQHFVQNMRHSLYNKTRSSTCYVEIEKLCSVPVKDASLLVKPCSVVCDASSDFLTDSLTNGSSTRNSGHGPTYSIGSCAIALPFLPLPLVEYVSPVPSLMLGDLFYGLRYERSR